MIALIPAAGSGTRMYPFTRANPKELFHINRKAVIDHAIESVHTNMGINNVFVIVGSHKGAIIDHVGDGSRLNNGELKIAYLFQEERKGLAHAIQQGKEWINEDFVVHVGDSFVQPKEELEKALAIHKKEKPFATIIVKEINDPTQHGIVKIDKEGNLLTLIEKPTLTQAKTLMTKEGNYLAMVAIYIFKPEIFDYIQRTPLGIKNEFQITDSIKLALKEGKKIKIYPINGEYIDIGNWESAEKAQNHFRSIKK